MFDMIRVPKQEWANLEERVHTLAKDKSYLQLVNNLMSSLGEVLDIQHTAVAILQRVLENLGGTNVALYYRVGSDIHYVDVHGEQKVLDAVDDTMVRTAMEHRELVEEQRDFSDTKMLTPSFTKASYWAVPLMVGDHLIGILKVEGMLMAMAAIRRHLQPFFDYAALILKNEIEGYLKFMGAAHLAAIVQSSNDAIIGKTLDGIITSWNRGAEEIYGYAKAEVLGQPISLLVPPERQDELPTILVQIKQGQPVEHYQTLRRRKDGRVISVSLTISPIKDAAGNILGASTIARDITEQKRAEESLRLAYAYNRSLIEASLDPLVTIGPDGRITDVNAATEAATGLAQAELIGTDFSDYFTEPDKARGGYQQVYREGSVRDYPLDLRHRDGRVTPVLYNASVYRDEHGQVVGVFAAARDITQRKRAEMELHRLNRALRTISACNQVLVRASDETELLRAICEVIVKESGYRMVWVGFAEQDEQKTVRPVAQVGCEEGYIEKARFTWADTERGRSPCGTAIRTGQPAVCHDIRTDPNFVPWRDEAVKRGYAACVVFPLLSEGKAFGALAIYSSEVDAFDATEVKQLSELADDLAYGILTLRTRADHRRAEEAVRAAYAYNRSLIQASLDPLVTIGPDGRITDVNAATETATGLARAELIGTDFSDYFTEPNEARAGYQKVYREGTVRDYPLILRHRDGRVTPVLYNASVYRDERGQVVGVFAAARDITEQKRAENTLRISEERHRMAQTIGHVGNWEYDLTTHQFWGSDEAKRICGFDPNQPDFVMEDVERCIPERERVHQTLIDLITSGKPYNLEFEIHPKNSDQPKVLSSIARLQHDEHGNPLKVLGVILDITGRVEAERRLRESEERLRLTLEATRVGVWEWDLKNDRWYASPTYYTMLGYEPDQGHGDRAEWLERVHPEDRAHVHGKIQEVLIGDFGGYAYEARMRHTDGTYHWVSVAGIGVDREASGKVTRMLGIRMDISDRKRAEMALQRSEQRKTILNQIAHIFLTASDREMYAQVLEVVLAVMKSRFGIFGHIGSNGDLVIPSLTGEVWSECKVSGKSVVFPKDTWGESLWGKALRERRTFCSDGPFHTPKGHVRIDHFLAVPLVFGNAAIGLLSVANAGQSYSTDDIELLENIAESISPILNARMQRDLQEKKRQQAEEEIRKLNAELETRVIQRTAQLEAANKELESFSYSVSHDLRAPLRAINGFASILIEDCANQLDEQGKHHLSIVRSEAERMGRLIDDLLAFSRMGRQAMEVADINMGELARKVFDECVAQTPDRQIRFTLQPLPPARGDAALLREVWVNLISNAIKYTRRQPVADIEILGRVEDMEMVYAVKDNGVGFDMKYVDRLFGVFQRLHSDADFEGTGVGLSLVHRIVARHGGRVWAEARVDAGATFYFTLPKVIKADS